MSLTVNHFLEKRFMEHHHLIIAQYILSQLRRFFPNIDSPHINKDSDIDCFVVHTGLNNHLRPLVPRIMYVEFNIFYFNSAYGTMTPETFSDLVYFNYQDLLPPLNIVEIKPQENSKREFASNLEVIQDKGLYVKLTVLSGEVDLSTGKVVPFVNIPDFTNNGKRKPSFLEFLKWFSNAHIGYLKSQSALYGI